MNLINGLRVIDKNVNNTDITYPQQLSQLVSPIDQQSVQQKKRYIPLVGNLFNKNTF